MLRVAPAKTILGRDVLPIWPGPKTSAVGSYSDVVFSKLRFSGQLLISYCDWS